MSHERFSTLGARRRVRHFADRSDIIPSVNPILSIQEGQLIFRQTRSFAVHLAPTALSVVLVLSAMALSAADTLPDRIADGTFWKLIEDFSEPGGSFQSENFSSNEIGFQTVIPLLQHSTKPGGAYIGVGPEQNFTYIAALRPRIAFILDIRRQNMVVHMIYKAAFELSESRTDFLSRLFSRKRPAGLSATATPTELFRAYETATADEDTYKKNLQDIRDLLLRKHKFEFTVDDRNALEHVYSVFRHYGPNLNYRAGADAGDGSRRGLPNYSDLMTATDSQGMQRSFLANEENYRFLRDLEMRNLIVPLTGDFGGPRALKAIGKYLREHDTTVTAFYVSNVEQYLFQVQGGRGNRNGGAQTFYENVAVLPLDSSSWFVRSGASGLGAGGMNTTSVASMMETLAAVRDDRIQTYADVFTLSK
jgi:hypothetical protein